MENPFEGQNEKSKLIDEITKALSGLTADQLAKLLESIRGFTPPEKNQQAVQQWAVEEGKEGKRVFSAGKEQRHGGKVSSERLTKEEVKEMTELIEKGIKDWDGKESNGLFRSLLAIAAKYENEAGENFRKSSWYNLAYGFADSLAAVVMEKGPIFWQSLSEISDEKNLNNQVKNIIKNFVLSKVKERDGVNEQDVAIAMGDWDERKTWDGLANIIILKFKMQVKQWFDKELIDGMLRPNEEGLIFISQLYENMCQEFARDRGMVEGRKGDSGARGFLKKQIKVNFSDRLGDYAKGDNEVSLMNLLELGKSCQHGWLKNAKAGTKVKVYDCWLGDFFEKLLNGYLENPYIQKN